MASWLTWGTPALRDSGLAKRMMRFIPRLQGNSQPKVDDIARGQVTGECFPGTDRDALWEDDIRGLDCRAIDADVHVGGDKHPLQVADLYRVRWAVELSIRLDPSMNCLDVIDAERPCSLKTLLHVSLIASTIAAILAHTHHLKTHPPQAGAPRTETPLHPQLLAWPLAVSCQSMAQAFDLKGTAAKRPSDQIAALLTHSGKDPNGRRRPSVLDQLRGWTRQPVVRKKNSNTI